MAKHRRQKLGRFTAIPHKVYWSADYQSLTFAERAVLLALAVQYNGQNNGDLSAAPAVMRKHGIPHAKTLAAAKKTLRARHLVTLTRRGGFGSVHKCDLLAITWEPIDTCDGKLDVQPTTAPPRSQWRTDSVTNLRDPMKEKKNAVHLRCTDCIPQVHCPPEPVHLTPTDIWPTGHLRCTEDEGCSAPEVRPFYICQGVKDFSSLVAVAADAEMVEGAHAIR